MSSALRCPGCRHKFAYESGAASVTCPKCGKILRVPAAARDENLGRRFAGYTLTKLLGKGAMAAVYEGRGDDDGRVAIKLLDREIAKDEELLVRFRREASHA